MIKLRDHEQELAGSAETVVRYWIIIFEPGLVPDKKVPIPQTDAGAIDFLRKLIALHKLETRLTLCRLTWNHDLWVDDGREYVAIRDGFRPGRIQRRRALGWRLGDAIYVGRGSRWGNLWRIGLARCGCRSAGECNHNSFRCETATEAVAVYREWITAMPAHRRAALLAPLRGRDLACWCPLDQPCHADVLLELANAPAGSAR